MFTCGIRACKQTVTISINHREVKAVELKLENHVVRKEGVIMSESFAGVSIPRFDGDYDHWSLLMENLL